MTVEGVEDFKRELRNLRGDRPASATDVGIFDEGLAIQAALNEFGLRLEDGSVGVPARPPGVATGDRRRLDRRD